jgi:hypothetical protein
MNKYSYLNLIKRNAKAYRSQHGIQLAVAQETLSREAGFANFHELTTVATRHPQDPRLMLAAIGTNELIEIIFETNVYDALSEEVEDLLGGAIAETNATDFTIENLDVDEASYDDATGAVSIRISFEYQGEQLPDRVYHGTTLHVRAMVSVRRVGSEWQLADGDSVVITEEARDLDLFDEDPLEDSRVN